MKLKDKTIRVSRNEWNKHSWTLEISIYTNSFHVFENFSSSSCWLLSQVWISTMLVIEKKVSFASALNLIVYKVKDVRVVRVLNLKNLLMKEIQEFAQSQQNIKDSVSDYNYF